MKTRIAMLLLAGATVAAPHIAAAKNPAKKGNFPTVDRVEFVLECMQRNESKQEFLYKCSCVIDEVAKKFTHEEYVEAATIARIGGMPGERTGIMRDPDKVKSKGQSYGKALSEARKQCGVPR